MQCFPVRLCGIEAGKAAANAVAEMLKNPFGAKPPKPGEGPSKEERENGFYDVLFAAEMPDGETLHYGVKGKYDPGYGSTSKMLAESAVCLAQDQLDCAGGFWTPAPWLDRLIREGGRLGDVVASAG